MPTGSKLETQLAWQIRADKARAAEVVVIFSENGTNGDELEHI